MDRIIATLFIALSAAGCASAPDESFEDDLAADVDDPTGKEDGVVRPVGTFLVQQDQGISEGITEFTLYSDKTFHMKTHVRARCSLGTPTCPSFERDTVGTYRYTKSGRNRYLRLTSETFNQYDRFRYTFNANEGALAITAIHEGTAGARIDLVRDDAGGYCSDTAHCGLLELDMTLCSPDGETTLAVNEAWTCIENACVPACLNTPPVAN